MTIADDLRQAAIDVFDALTGVPVIATYIELQVGAYIPGGTTAVVEVPHQVRMVREDKTKDSLANAVDVDNAIVTFLFVSSELPVISDTKDKVNFNSNLYVIKEASEDPVGAVTTLRCVRQ